MFDFLKPPDPELEIAKVRDKIFELTRYAALGFNPHENQLKINRLKQKIVEIEANIKPNNI